MFRRTPKKLCNELWSEGFRHSTAQAPGEEPSPSWLMWAITPGGTLVRLNCADRSSYQVTLYTPGSPAAMWRIGNDTIALDRTVRRALASARPVPLPGTIYGINYGGVMEVILMTHPETPEGLRWTIFRSATTQGENPRFTRTTSAGTFLDAGRLWGWNPRRLRLGTPGPRYTSWLVYREGKPAVIGIRDASLTGDPDSIQFFAPGHSGWPTAEELRTAKALSDWTNNPD